MANRIKQLMSERSVEVVFADIPAQYKDVGEMDYDDALHLVYKHIN
jgi:hypothetical protein